MADLTDDCPICGEQVVMSDEQGRVQEDHEVECPRCRAVLVVHCNEWGCDPWLKEHDRG